VRQQETLLNTDKTLRQHICDIVHFYLKKNNEDVLLTASQLDIGKSTIYKMLQSGELVL